MYGAHGQVCQQKLHTSSMCTQNSYSSGGWLYRWFTSEEGKPSHPIHFQSLSGMGPGIIYTGHSAVGQCGGGEIGVRLQCNTTSSVFCSQIKRDESRTRKANCAAWLSFCEGQPKPSVTLTGVFKQAGSNPCSSPSSLSRSTSCYFSCIHPLPAHSWQLHWGCSCGAGCWSGPHTRGPCTRCCHCHRYCSCVLCSEKVRPSRTQCAHKGSRGSQHLSASPPSSKSVPLLFTRSSLAGGGPEVPTSRLLAQVATVSLSLTSQH